MPCIIYAIIRSPYGFEACKHTDTEIMQDFCPAVIPNYPLRTKSLIANTQSQKWGKSNRK